MRTLSLVALLLASCTGKDDTPVDDTGGDTGQDTDTGVSSDAPSVTSLDYIDCEKQQSAGEVWSFTIAVTDPQGADTVDGGRVYVRDPDGNELASYEFPCDDAGTCSGSWRAAFDGIGCSMIGTVVLGFVVTDQLGFTSEEYRYQTE